MSGFNIISTAVASTISSGVITRDQSESWVSIALMLGIFVVFYLLLIRPQNRRAKQQRDMVNKLSNGDEIVTSGGLVGKVSKVDEQFMHLTIAAGTIVLVQRNAVLHVLPKGSIKAL